MFYLSKPRMIEFLCGSSFLLLVGCRLSAPMQVWAPPMMQAAVGKRIAVSKVVGPKPVAGPIHEKLISMVPRDSGRQLYLIDSATLQPTSNIQLASATDDDDPSDVALASAARRERYDYVLRGEVMPERTHKVGRRIADSADRLTVSWRLTAINESEASSGTPVVVDLQSSLERYPDLTFIADPQQQLVASVVRDTYRLLAPYLQREQVWLANPRASLGSSEVRRGNEAAMAGDWCKAEQIWERVLDRYPMQSAATHNLALAAAAAQNFSRARELARSAVRQMPLPMYQQTLVWIEQHQRDYHEAFGLPDPPEGWSLTRSSSLVAGDQTSGKMAR